MKYRTNIQTFTSSLRRRFAEDHAGSTAIEYALIASGISIAIIAAVNGIGSTLLGMFQSVVDIF